MHPARSSASFGTGKQNGCARPVARAIHPSGSSPVNTWKPEVSNTRSRFLTEVSRWGGLTATVHGRSVVAQVSYRRPDYDQYCVGIRLLDSSFSFARDEGFEAVDLGGTQPYKRKLAPEEGERWDFHICPARLYHMRRMGAAGQVPPPDARSTGFEQEAASTLRHDQRIRTPGG
jgi:hypothetical protein